MHPLPKSFGFLVLAWLCLHQPQEFFTGLGAWLKHATRFSHQEQLAQELRMTLAHHSIPADDATQVAGSNDAEPVETPAAPVPSSPASKILLFLVGILTLAPASARLFASCLASFEAGTRSRDVPVPVPRLAV